MDSLDLVVIWEEVNSQKKLFYNPKESLHIYENIRSKFWVYSQDSQEQRCWFETQIKLVWMIICTLKNLQKNYKDFLTLIHFPQWLLFSHM
jgi:hypothetical protein